MPRLSSSEHATETRDRILRAASDLFATTGFNGATLREITERAGANLAAVNYYFRTKEDLIISTIEEAVRPLVAARMTALQSCLEFSKPNLPNIDQMAEALVGPLLTFSKGENRNRLLLLMQIRSDPEGDYNAVVVEHFKPLHELFVTCFADSSIPELHSQMRVLVTQMNSRHCPSYILNYGYPNETENCGI